MVTLFDRARGYVAAMPAAISGQGGHQATFNVAVALIHGFALSDEQAWSSFPNTTPGAHPLGAKPS